MSLSVVIGCVPRDLNDIGCYIRVINGCHQLDKETRLVYVVMCLVTIVTGVIIGFYKYEVINMLL